jgi:hypothetical protein
VVRGLLLTEDSCTWGGTALGGSGKTLRRTICSFGGCLGLFWLANWMLLVSMKTPACKAKLNATAIRLRRPKKGMTD